MKSLGAKVKQVGAMIGTRDLDARSTGFMERVVQKTRDGADTSRLSDGEIQWINSLYKQHFGDAD
jgi:hypothetical protein